MGDGSLKKSKLTWPKTLVRKWLNIKNKSEDFHADDRDLYRGEGGDWRNNGIEREEACSVKKSGTETQSKKNAGRARRNKHEFDSPLVKQVDNLRIFTATWNVAGKSPPSYLNLEDWLHTSPPSDIYVLGFQEIVPLNAGNVLGTEDNGPARKWVSLIRRTLNSLPENGGGGGGGSCRTPSPVPHPVAELDSDFEGANSFQSLSKSLRMNDLPLGLDLDLDMAEPHLDRRFSVCDRFMLGHRAEDFYDQSFGYYCSSVDSPCDDNLSRSGSFVRDERVKQQGRDKSKYCLVASKQMVGIFLTVWVKSDLRDTVKNLKVSCVGRGLMGYLGNKGSISMSMSVHETSLCFVCSHLTSGQKEGDELRRNSDVLEILRKTRFPRMNINASHDSSPQTILEHDRVIWLGDLNYRIALSYRSAKALVEMRNWSALLEKDQLRVEQHKGRVFQGWNEGTIYFPPTYKYSNNSDIYAADDRLPKAKRRTPAWCDRILWYGSGLTQLSYVRGESRFSDHRPVYSLFSVEVESVSRNHVRKFSSYSSSRIEVEELLPQRYGYSELNPY
ncbi:hypothetical protein EUTSA_v10005867mg [Eutrema salsugineum]|uniref:Inositol polyphosphate-related phosphatase domain-containing protein n=1 Tax=Eutrema salsugineum TaxID=72664 RepID=V4LV30_EUTSA|nr:type I inositol polyphosphate 5-phosphatase 4 [Eutrema salsugineum]ESQ43748.1 hypothetical protein EUTSA_v10005867mg [Eutrema salsugineum]